MKRTIALLTATLLLGGCQSIFGHHAKLEVQPLGGAKTPEQSAIALEEGRQSLRAGNIAAGIVALQEAALDPASAAPAHNALGVAYAMLGRGDLAERFFQLAVAEAPDEAKYASNLSRFYQSRDAALAKAAMPVQAPVAASELAAAEAEATPPQDRLLRAGPGVVRVAAATPSTAITRVSAQEVTLRTIPAPLPRMAADGRRRNPRFTVATPIRANPARAYPIRIEIGR